MRWCFLLLLPIWVASDPSGQGLVFPQSNCRIRCENGGMCAFSFSDPSVHSCICLIGVYSGDRCQFKIGEDKSQTERSQDREKIAEQERNEAMRKEEEARLNDQRQMDYERKIQEEESRRKAQEAERQRYMEEYRRREEERRVMEEQRRQEMARREEIERNRVTTQQNEIRRPAQGDYNNQREEQTRAEQRAREEERRQEDLRKLMAAREEKKKQEEERQPEPTERPKQEHGRKIENYDSDELTDEDLEPDHEPDTASWNNDPENTHSEPTEQNSEETAIEKPPSNSLGSVAEVLEHAATKAAEEHGIDLGDEIMTEPHLEEEEEATEEDEEEHDPETVSAVAGVLEEAAVKTGEEHSIDFTADSSEEKKDDNDDYWDHHPKKEDLDYEVPKVMDSEEEIQHDQAMERDAEPTRDASENNVKDYDLEEGDDGWMYQKRADSQQASTSTAAGFAAVNVILFLRYIFL